MIVIRNPIYPHPAVSEIADKFCTLNRSTSSSTVPMPHQPVLACAADRQLWIDRLLHVLIAHAGDATA